MLACVLEKFGHAEQQQKHPADHLNGGQHARNIACGHDIAIANRAYRDHRKMYCLGKAERAARTAHAEVLSSRELRDDAEHRREEDNKQCVEREERKCRYRQSGHAVKEFLEQQSSVDQEDRDASADGEHDEPDSRHRKLEYQISVDHGLGKPGQQKYGTADEKYGYRSGQRPIKRFSAPHVWMIYDRSYVRAPQLAAADKSDDRQAETDTSCRWTDVCEQFFDEEGKNGRLDGHEVGERMRENDRCGNNARIESVAIPAADIMAKNKKFAWPATDTATKPTNAKEAANRTTSRLFVPWPSFAGPCAIFCSRGCP